MGGRGGASGGVGAGGAADLGDIGNEDHPGDLGLFTDPDGHLAGGGNMDEFLDELDSNFQEANAGRLTFNPITGVEETLLQWSGGEFAPIREFQRGETKPDCKGR